MKKPRRKSRSKTVVLDPKFWLRNSKDIALFRENKLKAQKGKCAITGVGLKVGCLDHTHADGIGTDGRCRGVLLSEVNMLEGRYLQLFKKAKLDKKYNLDFPSFLVNMGEYLMQKTLLNQSTLSTWTT